MRSLKMLPVDYLPVPMGAKPDAQLTIIISVSVPGITVKYLLIEK